MVIVTSKYNVLSTQLQEPPNLPEANFSCTLTIFTNYLQTTQQNAVQIQQQMCWTSTLEYLQISSPYYG